MTIKEMMERKAELGYSCERLSELSGVPLGTVQKIFSGTTKKPRFSTIAALENVLKKRSIRYEVMTAFGDKEKLSEALKIYALEGADDETASHPQAETEIKIIEDVRSGEWSHQGMYSVDDYLSLPGEIRVELIDGYFYDLAAPSSVHQIISTELSFELNSFIKKNNGECRVFTAPFDIQLDKDDKTMIQPDISVICKRSGYTSERGIGAPDLVIEILSPSTKNKDMRLKLTKYAQAGVREYWIVDPDARIVIVYDFENEKNTGIYSFDTAIPVSIWDGKCKIDFSLIQNEIEKALGKGG